MVRWIIQLGLAEGSYSTRGDKGGIIRNVWSEGSFQRRRVRDHLLEYGMRDDHMRKRL